MELFVLSMHSYVPFVALFIKMIIIVTSELKIKCFSISGDTVNRETSAKLDLAIRGGTIVDGTGEPGRIADVGVRDGRFVCVGEVNERARREIDATGMLVTPGWVDIHTHYDGQATWDSMLSPSCWHGVTTVVMGNCGVGFAPVHPGDQDYLIKLMEGVEDIPGTALSEGIDWQWESFPEYLNAIEAKPHPIDIGAQIPHAALRLYVMGERGADHTEVPTPEEITEMSRLVRESIEAGALGFTTSRTVLHRSSDGRHTPSLTATSDELLGISCALGEVGQGAFEMVTDHMTKDDEWELMRSIVRASGGRPLSVSMVQYDEAPFAYREQLEQLRRSNEIGLPIRGQVANRAIGILLGLETTLNPFSGSANYKAIKDLPLPERVARMKDPEVRAAILADRVPKKLTETIDFEKIYELGNPPNYEPAPEDSLSARAERLGVTREEHIYDCLLGNEGRALLYAPFVNYAEFNHDAVREMLLDENTVPGLGDAGAHCGLICDGSFPTFLLTHWARDRTRGEKLPLEWLVRRQTHDTARAIGLCDRGTIEPGMKADLNVIDFEKLGIGHPEVVYDLPAGGRRLLQKASGYVATIQTGEVTFENGESTGALPGKLIRGPQTVV